MFKQRKAELIELSDIDPEKICLEDRPDILDQQELVDFDPEAYLADFFEFEQVKPKIDYKLTLGKYPVQEAKELTLK